jgi:dephospho-CoA kinase
MTTSNNRIIGLAGTFGSGKDTLAGYLVAEYNYLHVSTSDMVRQQALQLHGSIERPVLHTTANELRARSGPGILTTLALERYQAAIEKYYGVVVSGIRSIGEAEAILTAGGVMVFVDAPVEIRYERMTSRQRDAETQLTLEEFKEGEAKELAAADPADKTVQNLEALRRMASVHLTNSHDREEFLREAVHTLGL